MAITTADIHAAADALAAQGKRATLAAVRAALGGGSFTTIGEALKTWHAPAVHKHQPPAVPPVLTDGAARMAAALWAQATEQAHQGLADARAELEQQRAALEAQRQEAVEAADALAVQLADTRQELETARQEAKALRTELAMTRERLAVAMEQAQAAQAAAATAKEAETAALVDAAALRGRLEGLHQAQAPAPRGSKAAHPPLVRGSLEVGPS